MFAIRYSRTKRSCRKFERHRRVPSILAFAVVLLAAHGARAQSDGQALVTNQSATPAASSSSSSMDSIAESALEEGRQLMILGMHVDAMVQFHRSARLHPTATATFLIGMCEAGIGHDTRARMFLRRALAESPGLEPLNRGLALRTLDRINARLGRLKITVSETNASIRVDGRAVERDDVIESEPSSDVFWVAGTSDLQTLASTGMRVFEVLVDPGEHRLEAVADGFDAVSVTRDVRPAEVVPIDMKLVPSAVRIRREADLRAQEDKRRTYRSLGGILAAIGGSAILVGGGTGIAAFYRSEDVKHHCDIVFDTSRCNAAGLAAYAEAKNLAAATEITIPSGIALGAFGTWLFLSQGHSREAGKVGGASLGLRALDINIGVGNNETRVLLTGSF